MAWGARAAEKQAQQRAYLTATVMVGECALPEAK